MIIYTVAPGDTVSSIAARFGVPPSRIILENEINPDQLSVGQALVIAYRSRIHTVQPGDTVYSIAAEYGVDVNQIFRNNPSLNGSGEIFVGQSLVISYADQSVSRPSLETMGYIYTFIERDVLRRTLPYLTYLAIFSYGIKSDGSLIVPDDTELISIAKEYRTRPMMVLTSLSENGTFSTDNLSEILNDSQRVANLIENTVNTATGKGYDAVNCDFEYIAPTDKEAYNRFIAALRSALLPYGITVNVSLAPKTSDDQSGLLYEAIDYRTLGRTADSVLLMTYEWGYTYSEPRAVAPINSVTQVVDYAVSVIDRQKIYMGMPNYGYDWELPWVEGRPATSLSNTAAIQLANESGSEIFFDEIAKTPYFNYSDNDGIAHQVWFEDARSVDAKLALAANRRLLGVGIWNATKWFPALWFVLNLKYNIARD